MDNYCKNKILKLEEKLNNYDILIGFLLSRLDFDKFDYNQLPDNIKNLLKPYYKN